MCLDYVQVNTILVPISDVPLRCHTCLDPIRDTNEDRSHYRAISHNNQEDETFRHHHHQSCYKKFYDLARNKYLKANNNKFEVDKFIKSGFLSCSSCAHTIDQFWGKAAIDLSGQPHLIDRSHPPLMLIAKYYVLNGIYTGAKWGGLAGTIYSVIARNLYYKISLPIVIDLGSLLGILTAPLFGAVGGVIGGMTSGLSSEILVRNQERMKSVSFKTALRTGWVALGTLQTLLVTFVSVSLLNRISLATPLPPTLRVAALLSLSMGIMTTSAANYRKQLKLIS